MTALLQEIISVYPLLNPSQLTAAASNRVCNALALLQCVASHNETRTLFLNGISSPLIYLRTLRDSIADEHVSF
jgi:CCR4-NOT transcription complex subunit 9